MRVRIEQPGQHGGARQVDHLRAGGHLAADGADAALLDDDDLVAGDSAGFGVDQPARFHRDELRDDGDAEE